jgi:hypothetical protein
MPRIPSVPRKLSDHKNIVMDEKNKPDNELEEKGQQKDTDDPKQSSPEEKLPETKLPETKSKKSEVMDPKNENPPAKKTERPGKEDKPPSSISTVKIEYRRLPGAVRYNIE